MNGNSKREKVDSFIQRAVSQAVHEIAFNHPNQAGALRELKRNLEIIIAYNISGDIYRFKELQDIMAWKKPPNE